MKYNNNVKTTTGAILGLYDYLLNEPDREITIQVRKAILNGEDLEVIVNKACYGNPEELNKKDVYLIDGEKKEVARYLNPSNNSDKGISIKDIEPAVKQTIISDFLKKFGRHIVSNSIFANEKWDKVNFTKKEEKVFGELEKAIKIALAGATLFGVSYLGSKLGTQKALNEYKKENAIVQNDNNIEDEKDVISNYVDVYLTGQINAETLYNMVVEYINTEYPSYANEIFESMGKQGNEILNDTQNAQIVNNYLADQIKEKGLYVDLYSGSENDIDQAKIILSRYIFATEGYVVDFKMQNEIISENVQEITEDMTLTLGSEAHFISKILSNDNGEISVAKINDYINSNYEKAKNNSVVQDKAVKNVVIYFLGNENLSTEDKYNLLLDYIKFNDQNIIVSLINSSDKVIINEALNDQNIKDQIVLNELEKINTEFGFGIDFNSGCENMHIDCMNKINSIYMLKHQDNQINRSGR